MVSYTVDTIQNMLSIMADLSKTIEELKSTITALRATIQSPKRIMHFY